MVKAVASAEKSGDAPVLSSPANPRITVYQIIGSVWLIVTIYAVLHDQYIAWIAPRHFTYYHGPLLGFQDAQALAAIWATLAAFAPGMILGAACALSARLGPWAKLSLREVVVAVAGVVLVTECAAAGTGLIVYWRGEGIYPDSFYPARSLPLLITQTIQLTCYFTSATLSFGMMFFLSRKRWIRSALREVDSKKEKH